MPDTDEPIDVGHAASAKSLNRSTLALHANTVVTSILGFGFLIAAARLYDADDLGDNMALVSAMMLIAAIAETNAGMALVRFLPRLASSGGRLVSRVMLITTIFAAVLSAAFVWLAPRVDDNFRFVSQDTGLAVAFVLAVMSWNVFVIGDSVLTASRFATWVPAKNAIHGMLKLIALIALAAASFGNGVFLAWAISVFVLVVPVTVLTFRIPLRRLRSNARENRSFSDSDDAHAVFADRRNLVRYLGYDYLASVMAQVGTSALPLVVIATLGATDNAYFAVAFTIVVAVEQLALNAGIALTVEGAHDERRFAHLVRHSFLRFGGLLTLLVIVGVVGAPFATFLFGDQYGSETTNILRLLLLGLIPEAIVIFYESVSRIRVRTERIAMVNGAQAAVTIALAIVLAGPYGLTGVGLAWIIGHSVTAIAVLPGLLELMFPRNAQRRTEADV